MNRELVTLLLLCVSVPTFAGGTQSCMSDDSNPEGLYGRKVSVESVQELACLYNAFLDLDPLSITVTDVNKFVTQVVFTLMKYPRYRPIAEEYFTCWTSRRRCSIESRVPYKVLFASILYIVNANTQGALDYLKDTNTSPQYFKDMNAIRSSLRAYGIRSLFQSSSVPAEGDLFEPLIRRFMKTHGFYHFSFSSWE